VRLGRVYMMQRKYKDAKAAFKRAHHIVEEKLGKDHPYTGDNIYELGCFYFMKPEEVGTTTKAWTSDKAESYFLRALQIKEKSMGTDHPDVARILNRLGSLYIERVQFDVAEKYLVRTYEIRKNKQGLFHSRTGQTLKHMMTLYEAQENHLKAIESGLQALQIFEKLPGNAAITSCANICIRLGELYKLTEGHRSVQAKKCLNRALEIQQERLGPDHPIVAEIKEAIYQVSIPIPPPLPKKVLIQETVEEKPIPQADDKAKALLAELLKFGENKRLKQMKMKQAANKAAAQGWWKQNYVYVAKE